MITKDVKNMWVDKQGNTCFGIRPIDKKEEKRQEGGAKNVNEKASKRARK